MTKTRSTKRALLLSALSLLMCVSMLIGSTFAWFTDSVTSGSNIIKSGNLDVEMYWADGTKAVPTADADWTDASNGAIFDYDLWEPGYTEVRHIKIANEGTLALKYQLSIAATGEVSELADVIDVYYVDPAVQVTDRADLSEGNKLGTLSEVLDEISTTASGNLKSGETHTITLALKMQESAGNDYQDKSIGSSFAVKLSAIQLNFENDSFGPDYDEGLDPITTYVSTAAQLQAAVKNSGKIVLMDDISLDSSAEFMATNGNGSLLDLKSVDITLDLNGHDIVAEADALMEGKTEATALFLVHHSTLNIVGEGEIITKNKSIPVYGWLESEINIYGGTFKGNAYTRNESDVYVNNDTVTINVYGGDFSESVYAFNAHDTSANAPVIILHEGVTYKDFLKNGTTNVIANDINKGRIVLAEGCTKETVQINGEAWNKVVKGSGVSSASELMAALDTEGAYIVLQNDVALDQSVTVNKSVTLNLNNKTLTTMGLDFAADATIENGTIASGGNTNLVPHLKASAGTLTMNNVAVDVKHHLNANASWSEATGMEVQNAKAILNNCNIKINNVTKAQWVYSYGIGLNNAEITVNGGSITAECVAGTAANGPTNPNAISTMGECTATLNNVNVTAMYYVTTVNGHATVNTTDKGITSANIVDNRGGSHTLNYID